MHYWLGGCTRWPCGQTTLYRDENGGNGNMARTRTSFSRASPRPGPGRPRRDFRIRDLAMPYREEALNTVLAAMRSEQATWGERKGAGVQIIEWVDGKTAARPW